MIRLVEATDSQREAFKQAVHERFEREQREHRARVFIFLSDETRKRKQRRAAIVRWSLLGLAILVVSFASLT